MLRTFINSNINILNVFSKVYRFLPNENTIRPTLEILEEKKNLKRHISECWNSERDFIKANVFDFETFIDTDNKIKTYNKLEYDGWVFKKCQFPYNTTDNHWILWKYSDTMESFIIDNNNINKINSIIEGYLKDKVKNDNFDFGWYPNPKPSIPDFFHVHVFWSID
jgi:hypothetical protein